MRTVLVVGSFMVFALVGCSVGSDDPGEVEQGKKVEPSDETAVLLLTLPSAFPIQSTSSLRLPGAPQHDGRASSQGEWIFDYVLGTDHVLVEPGTPIEVRPGGCLYTSYSSLVQGGYAQITDKDCDLGLVAGSSKTHALGAMRLHFGTDPLRVDFGKKARPHVENSKGATVFGAVGSQAFGNWPGYSDQLETAEWKLNFQTVDVATGKPSDYLAAPIRPGKYTLKFETVGLASKSVTVTAGTIADLAATPADIRSTVHFTDDDPAPFDQAATQVLDLQLGTDEDRPGYLLLRTGGFDAKFLPTGTGSDSVTYLVDSSNAVAKKVSVPARGTANVVLSRVDVDDVRVNGGGAAQQMITGRWSLDFWDGTDWSNVNTCYSQSASGRCTGGTSASGLYTKRGVFVSEGKYRVTVVYKTEADPEPKTKTYELSLP